MLLVAALLVFRIVWGTVVVQGDSMEPALASWDYLLVTHGYDEPRRGDIVSIREETPGEMPYLKRVVGLPGDVVEVSGDRAWVNGRPEEASRLLTRPAYHYPQRFEVPAGHILVLGDNRPVSQDSRHFGPVPIASVNGRALFVFWPPAHAQRLDAPRPGT